MVADEEVPVTFTDTRAALLPSPKTALIEERSAVPDAPHSASFAFRSSGEPLTSIV
jgi:hypothetical protein